MASDPELATSAFDHNAPATRDACDHLYADLRQSCPVFHSDRWGGFWGATRHHTVREIGRDAATFSSGYGVMVPPIGQGRPLLPMEVDGERHQTYRSILLPLLGPKAIEVHDAKLRSITREMIDSFATRGHADLYEEYAKDIPTVLITHLLGIAQEERFWEWTEALIYGRLEDPRGTGVRQASDGLYGFFEEVVARREATADRGEDLVSKLIVAEHDGLIARDEVIDLCFFLLIAGLENTAFAIRAALWHLAAYPDDRARLLADPTLLRPVIEECLRMYAPVTGLARQVTTGLQLDGQTLEPGDRVMMLFGAAGRDPELFEDPNEFRLDRRGNPHLAFGAGMHRCLGSHLARLEMKVALAELLARIPDYELAEPETTSWHPAEPLRAHWDGAG